MGWAAQAGFVSTSKRRRAPGAWPSRSSTRAPARTRAPPSRAARAAGQREPQIAVQLARKRSAVAGSCRISCCRLASALKRKCGSTCACKALSSATLTWRARSRHRGLLLGLGQAQLRRALLAPTPPAQRQMHGSAKPTPGEARPQHLPAAPRYGAGAGHQPQPSTAPRGVATGGERPPAPTQHASRRAVGQPQLRRQHQAVGERQRCQRRTDQPSQNAKVGMMAGRRAAASRWSRAARASLSSTRRWRGLGRQSRHRTPRLGHVGAGAGPVEPTVLVVVGTPGPTSSKRRRRAPQFARAHHRKAQAHDGCAGGHVEHELHLLPALVGPRPDPAAVAPRHPGLPGPR